MEADAALKELMSLAETSKKVSSMAKEAAQSPEDEATPQKKKKKGDKAIVTAQKPKAVTLPTIMAEVLLVKKN